jgi:hypothetical protein
MPATDASWLNLLIQIPLVGVFIWYSLEMSKRAAETQTRFMDALDKRDMAFEARNRAVIEHIQNLDVHICEHDTRTQPALRQIEELHRAHAEMLVGKK